MPPLVPNSICTFLRNLIQRVYRWGHIDAVSGGTLRYVSSNTRADAIAVAWNEWFVYTSQAYINHWS